MEKKNRKRMTQCFSMSQKDRSMENWVRIKHPIRVIKNYVMIWLCKLMPDWEFKNHVYRKLGMKIGKHVRILGCNFDVFFPELIEIGNETTIGSFTVILTHEFLPDEYRKGPVKIGKNVLIGTMTLILPGVTIGDNSRIAAYSLVNRNVPPGSFFGGVPVKDLGK